MRRGWLLLALVLAVVCSAASGAACGSQADNSTFNPDAGVDATLPVDDGGSILPEDGGLSFDGALSLTLTPTDAVVDVVSGQPVPTVQYVLRAGGQQVPASFTVDRGEIGSINPAGVFAPKGSLGGKATVTALYKGQSASTSVTVRLKVSQNGDPAAGDAGGGAGGNGGVGGEGPGAAVDNATKAVLDGNPTQDAGLAWLYPYDKTVWPRGILAPLLQWKPGTRSYEAVKITITEAAFEYTGYFARTATPFIHHPIPQAVWKQMLNSNGGEEATITLTFASGGAAYGPITEKWKIASAPLKGTVYYNSYGTALAKNYCCTIGGAQFGGATLAIRGGSTDPVLVAGTNGNDSQCRVCHSVSADGSSLVTQQGQNYGISSHYNLKAGNAETSLTPAGGRLAWPALSPDGTFLFSNSSPIPGGSTQPSALYAVPSGAAIASTGLPSGLGASLPAFSPDGKKIAFTLQAGPGADQKTLAVIDFDNATKTFSNLTSVHTPQGGPAYWPSFLPTNNRIVFQVETVYNGRDYAGTRSRCDESGACSNVGAHGELWWVDLATKQAARLDNANGKGHAPTGPNAHDDDTTLNYEPTVNPVPSGGYAWVVFTSRRLYGNVATINPFWSDPRYHDISKDPTPKKLWVAAIDLNAAPGTDPSHPAFYLPAQELLAGNSRGFWVVDPCKPSGNACETGDECCGGFCRPGGDAGGLVCTDQKPTCAQEFEKCTTSADCCSPSHQCINGRCATPIPR